MHRLANINTCPKAHKCRALFRFNDLTYYIQSRQSNDAVSLENIKLNIHLLLLIVYLTKVLSYE